MIGITRSEERETAADGSHPYDDLNWDDRAPRLVGRFGNTGGHVDNRNQRVDCVDRVVNGLPDDVKGLVDVALTSWSRRQRFPLRPRDGEAVELRRPQDRRRPAASRRLTPEQQRQYRWILYMEGHAAADRLGWYLRLGFLVFVVQTRNALADRSWIHAQGLREGEHYVSVESDFRNFAEQLRWARDNDDACRQIAARARQFWKEKLSKSPLLQYVHRILLHSCPPTSSSEEEEVPPTRDQMQLRHPQPLTRMRVGRWLQQPSPQSQGRKRTCRR